MEIVAYKLNAVSKSRTVNNALKIEEFTGLLQ
jgi:hypothetical protein